jgi:hypothetical protein
MMYTRADELKVITEYTSPQKAWDTTFVDGGPEGGTAGDITYSNGVFFPTLDAAQAMKEGPIKNFKNLRS